MVGKSKSLYYDRAHDTHDNHPIIFSGSGGVYGHISRQQRKWRDAIQADLDYAEAHANLGIPFLATERPEEAEKEFKTAKGLFENQGRD